MTDGKGERMGTIAVVIYARDDRELGNFPFCDFYFPHQVGGKGTG